MNGISNVWNAVMHASTELKNSVGEIIGTVICQKRSRLLAPSIAATSYSSCGMPCKPARKITIMLLPMAAHNATAINAGIAQPGSPNQPGPLKPVPVRCKPICQMISFQKSVLRVEKPQPDVNRGHHRRQMRHEKHRTVEGRPAQSLVEQ